MSSQRNNNNNSSAEGSASDTTNNNNNNKNPKGKIPLTLWFSDEQIRTLFSSALLSISPDAFENGKYLQDLKDKKVQLELSEALYSATQKERQLLEKSSSALITLRNVYDNDKKNLEELRIQIKSSKKQEHKLQKKNRSLEKQIQELTLQQQQPQQQPQQQQ